MTMCLERARRRCSARDRNHVGNFQKADESFVCACPHGQLEFQLTRVPKNGEICRMDVSATVGVRQKVHVSRGKQV